MRLFGAGWGIFELMVWVAGYSVSSGVGVFLRYVQAVSSANLTGLACRAEAAAKSETGGED